MEDFKLNTIEEAIADFREGKFIIVVDDEDRENEGDFIIAAEKITPEKVNFMLKEGLYWELLLRLRLINWKVAQRECLLLTVPLRFRHWLTQIQLPLLSDVRDISILCMHKIKVY